MTLQERLMIRASAELRTITLALNSENEETLIVISHEKLEQIIRHTIEETIKEGCENLPKAQEEPPHAGYTAVEAGMYSYAKGYNQALTDTQHALRGIMK
jgi:hypothetical protein